MHQTEQQISQTEQADLPTNIQVDTPGVCNCPDDAATELDRYLESLNP